MHGQLTRILSGLATCRSHCREASAKAAHISHWSIGEHLEHVAKANSSLYQNILLTSTGPTVSHGISWIGRICLMTNWVPRGKGKSPVRLHPSAIALEALEQQLDQQHAQFSALDGSMSAIVVDARRYGHHVFGGLSKIQLLRFIEIHQHHHLKIMRDISASLSTKR